MEPVVGAHWVPHVLVNSSTEPEEAGHPLTGDLDQALENIKKEREHSLDKTIAKLK